MDNGSSANILYYPTFQLMRIDRKRLTPSNAPLVGFNGMKVMLVVSITLPVTIGTYPQQVTRDITFLVMDCLSAYNAIIGHPTLNAWRAATSTYHLLLKFPREYGIGKARGDQVATRECYVAMLKMDEQGTTMNIEERRVKVDLTEELETIPLEKNTRIE